MDERSCAEAVAQWFADDVGIETAYPFPITNSESDLPDVVVHVTRKVVSDQPPELLPEFGLQQTWSRQFTIVASLMVEVNGQNEGAASAADAAIRAFGAEVERLVWEDPTLGERVPVCSPRLEFNYEQPFIERQDGVRGRYAEITMLVAEAIGAPE